MRRTLAVCVPTMFLSLALAACGPEPRPEGDGSSDADASQSGSDSSGQPETRPDAPPIATQGPCEKMDLLFVIDDSGSMSEEQTNLAAAFPKFISVLDGYELPGGRKLDYRLGITTTGRTLSYTIESPIWWLPATTENITGEDGRLRQSCGMTRRWIERSDPDVSTTFACAAQVGVAGSAMEMPLAASKLALSDRIFDGTNAGFLRDDALLAVVMLTDEDDCSREDTGFTIGATDDPCVGGGLKAPAEYVAFLDALTGERGRWAAAVIAGPGPGACSSSLGTAAEASRLKDFVAQAGPNAVLSSICDGDLDIALANALGTFEAACQNFPQID